MQVAGRADVMPSELVDVVQTDPGLTAKVLKAANSAYYGFREEIASLQDSGTRLGVNVLTNLIVTTCGGRYFRDYGQERDSEAVDLWTRCVTNALSAKLIARTHGNCDPELAYTAALLQDIGSIVVERFLAEFRDDIIDEAASCGSLLDAEQRILGLNHAEIGARLARRWKLPEVLVDTIRYHHTPDLATIDPILAGTTHLAETLSWAVGAGAEIGGLTFDVSAAALAITGLDMDSLRGLDEQLLGELERAQDFL
ncbi:MAG: putative nucleotidyltransferase with HDIG domain [Chlamydiales bacterium]|jgi:putative nucleotidyltransferase with HDIG domain